MSTTLLKQLAPLLRDRWGEATSTTIMQLAEQRLQELCLENAADPKAVKKHTELKIYPFISLYEAMQKQGILPHEAQEFLDCAYSDIAKPGAAFLSKVVHICGLYNLYPAMFTFVSKQSFGSAAGFKATYYKKGPKHSRFDMTQCIYCDTCRKYGCPELTRCFCHVDDVNNGDLHPRLCWNRSQCMGEGADYCDFDIFVAPKQ